MFSSNLTFWSCSSSGFQVFGYFFSNSNQLGTEKKGICFRIFWNNTFFSCSLWWKHCMLHRFSNLGKKIDKLEQGSCHWSLWSSLFLLVSFFVLAFPYPSWYFYFHPIRIVHLIVMRSSLSFWSFLSVFLFSPLKWTVWLQSRTDQSKFLSVKFVILALCAIPSPSSTLV